MIHQMIDHPNIFICHPKHSKNRENARKHVPRTCWPHTLFGCWLAWYDKLPAGRPERRSHVHTSEETARIHGNMVIFVRKAGNMFTINTSINDVSRAKFQRMWFCHTYGATAFHTHRCHCLGARQLVERRQQLSLGPGIFWWDRVPTKKRLGFFEALPGFFFKKRCWKLKKCWPFASGIRNRFLKNTPNLMGGVRCIPVEHLQACGGDLPTYSRFRWEKYEKIGGM